MWDVRFAGFDPQIGRRQIYTFFQPYGNITKLFVKEDRSDATIYFDNERSAAEAALAIQQPNQHNFQLEESNTDHHRFVPIIDNGQNGSINGMDECFGTMTYMYDILGNKIPTLIGDDGDCYVAIKHLQNSGFRLFPAKPNKLAYNTHIQEYVRMYLQIQMHKFICKYKCNIHEEDKARIIASVAAGVDEQIAQNSRISSRCSVDHDPGTVQLRRPKDMTTTASNVSAAKSTTSIVSEHGSHTSAGDRQSPSISTQQQDIPKKQPTASLGGFSKNTNGYAQPVNNTPQISADLRRSISINPIPVPLNTQIKVIVKHVQENNPKIAYLHLVSNQDKLESLNRDVVAEAVNGPVIHPSDGLICAISVNSTWKRAYVQSLRPLRVLLIDYGTSPRLLRDDTPLRGLSEALQAQPWYAVRATTNTDADSAFRLQQNCTYFAVTRKKYDDGTYVFQYNSKLPNEEISKTTASMISSEEPLQIFPAGINLAMAQTSTPRTAMPIVRSQPSVKTTQLFSDQSMQIPSILDKISGGMQVILEFHFETYCKNNSVVAFICMKDMTSEDLDIFEEIANIPPKYLKRYNDITSIKIGDMIAIQSPTKEEGYTRGIVYNIKNGVYSTAKVDTGTLQDVKADAILDLHADIKKHPYLTCICTYPNLDDLQDIDDDIFNVNSEKQLFKDGSTYKIQGMIVKPWNPLLTHGPAPKNMDDSTTLANISEIPSSQTGSSCSRVTQIGISQPNCMTAPQLQVNDIVRIISIDFVNLTFYVQTRDMYSFYRKEIRERINAMDEQGCKRLENPQVNQSVLVRLGNSLDRGIIESINNQRISVKMIDVGGPKTVTSENLFESNVDVANKKYCCAHFKLDGLETLEDEAVSFLNRCVEDKEKFTVTRFNDNRACLVDNTKNNLLDKLDKLSLTTKPPGYWYKNLKHVSIPITRMSMLFSYMNIENGELYFTISDDELRTQIGDLINQISEYCEGAEDYHPSKGEICFAFYMEEWYRAHVISANKEQNKYLVFFLDFGNCEEVNSQTIRCLPDESYGKVAPLCTKFIIPDLQKICKSGVKTDLEQLLEESLIMGTEYEVNVLQQLQNNSYLVDIPAVSTILPGNSDDF